MDSHQCMPNEDWNWTRLFLFIIKFQIVSKFWNFKPSVSPDLAFCIEAICELYVFRGESRHEFLPIRIELNDIVGRQHSDQVNKQQHPVICHPTHRVDDKWGVSLVSFEHVLYYLDVILIVTMTVHLPVVHHPLWFPLVGVRWSQEWFCDVK